MDTRNWFELIIRRSEVAELTADQRGALAVELIGVEEKLAQILERYGIAS